MQSNYIDSEEESQVTFEGDLDKKRNTLRKIENDKDTQALFT